MLVPTKQGEVEIEQEWLDLWNATYYDVPRAIQEAVIWAHDNPSKQKTKRGARAFLGNWIRRSCAKRPLVARPQALAESPNAVEPKEVRLAHLAQLRASLKRGETP